MEKLLSIAAVAEGSMGVALLAVPSLIGQLLLGTELTGVAVALASVTGIALIGLAVACWPGTPLVGMLTYSALATVFFLCLGIRGEWVGPLLWPALVLHAALTLLLAWRVVQGK